MYSEKLKFSAAALLLGGAMALPASASVVGIGDDITVAESGHVWVTFLGSDAGYTSVLGLVDGSASIFNNHATTVGTSVDLGVFAAGTVLQFFIHVLDTDKIFYSGDASGNSDGFAHAAANPVGNVTYVGFEDLEGGGDKDYNDVNFSVTSTPLPAGGVLLLGGLAALGLLRRRRG